MANPTWSEIQKFGDWMETRGFDFAVYCRGADTENYEAFKEVFG